METNSSNFNFEEYQKKNEGIFQRFSRWLGKHLKRIVRIIFTVGAATVIISGIALWKQFNTSDAGKVIESLYQDAKDDIVDTRQFLTYVQLPDSLERTDEVQKLRAFQNNVYSFSLLYLSIVKEPHFFESKNKTKDEQFINFQQLTTSWLQNLIFIGGRNKEIFEECKEIANYFAEKKDSFALSSINVFTMDEALHFQEDFNMLLLETKDNLSKELDSNDSDGFIEVVKAFLTNKKLYNNYRIIHRTHLMFLNSVNIRLLTIKNGEIHKKHGRLKKSAFKNVLIPSFLSN